MTWREVASFFVAGDPKAQPRQRHRVIQKSGRAFAANYTPGDAPVRTWKDLVALEAEKHLPVSPLTGPLRVSINFLFQRPKSHYRTGRYSQDLKDSAPMFHVSKPDRDNAEKAILDILTQIGFWRDDSQIVAGEVCKYYSPRGRSGALVTIEELST